MAAKALTPAMRATASVQRTCRSKIAAQKNGVSSIAVAPCSRGKKVAFTFTILSASAAHRTEGMTGMVSEFGGVVAAPAVPNTARHLPQDAKLKYAVPMLDTFRPTGLPSCMTLPRLSLPGVTLAGVAVRRSFLKSIATSLAVPFLPQAATAQHQSAGAPALPRPDDAAYWSKVRDQFMLARDKVFFNNGTIGAMPKVVFDRTVEHLRKMATDLADWDYHGADWIAGYGPATEIRAKAARLLNAETDEIALTENVTAAMSYVADGLELEPGSEILISDQEHPGGQSPWLNAAKRHQATVQMVKIPKPANSASEVMDIFRNALNARTRVLAISHVITAAGTILPAREMCAEARARGIFTVLDGAQAFGHIKVDLRDLNCDAYVGCFHKWLLAPAGTGFLYLRRDRARDVWTTLPSSQWNNHQDEGYRLTQRGTGSLSLLAGLDAALDFHNGIGPGNIHQRIKYLGDGLRDGLRHIRGVTIHTSSDAAMSAGISVFGVDGVTAAQLQDEFWNRGRLRPRASGIGVRLSTHIFNSPQEVEKTLGIVRSLAKA